MIGYDEKTEKVKIPKKKKKIVKRKKVRRSRRRSSRRTKKRKTKKVRKSRRRTPKTKKKSKRRSRSIKTFVKARQFVTPTRPVISIGGTNEPKIKRNRSKKSRRKNKRKRNPYMPGKGTDAISKRSIAKVKDSLKSVYIQSRRKKML